MKEPFNEDRLEEIYWEYADAIGKKSYDSRSIFKNFCRKFARETLEHYLKFDRNQDAWIDS